MISAPCGPGSTLTFEQRVDPRRKPLAPHNREIPHGTVQPLVKRRITAVEEKNQAIASVQNFTAE